MKESLNVGFITTLSGRWPRELPQKRNTQYSEWLKTNIPDINLIHVDSLVDSPKAINEVSKKFRMNSVDLVVLVYGAFTGDDISTILAENLNVPIILWAPREVGFHKDDRLYANALVALTMNSAALRRLDYISYPIYGNKEEEDVADKVKRIIKAYSVLKKLKGTTLGLFGYRPTAFYNSTFNEALIRKTFGIRMEETDLKAVFDRMDNIPKDQYEADMLKVGKDYNTSNLPEGHLENHSKLYLALKDLMKEQGYDYASIKCWPEMGQLKTTPCAVLGRLTDEDLHIGCEGDVDAELAAIVQNYISGLPCFVTDMINIDEDENLMTFWHCGNAAPSLKNDKYEFTINNHPLAGQGTAFYGSLKTGKVTIARFYNENDSYKLFLLRGEAIDMDRYTKGVMVNVKVEEPVSKIVKNIIDEGIPHHYSVVWDDVADTMIDVCKLLDIPVVEL